MSPGGVILPLALPIALAKQNQHASRNLGCRLTGNLMSRAMLLAGHG